MELGIKSYKLPVLALSSFCSSNAWRFDLSLRGSAARCCGEILAVDMVPSLFLLRRVSPRSWSVGEVAAWIAPLLLTRFTTGGVTKGATSMVCRSIALTLRFTTFPCCLQSVGQSTGYA